MRASLACGTLKVNGTHALKAISVPEERHFLITLVNNGFLMQRGEASDSYQDPEAAKALRLICLHLSNIPA